MLRKWGAFVLLVLATPFLAAGQNTGKLTGTIIDAETGDPLPTANVILEGTQLGTATNVNGQYTIIGVPVGTYDVRASFVGYQPVVIDNVDITAGYTRELNFELEPGQQLETIVVEYEQPMIQKDAIGVPNITSSEEIANLPVRGAANIAGLQAGVVQQEGSGNLYVRGGREQDVAYYVDGVRVIGSADVPALAVQQQEMLIGSIPARYGDVMSGVISVSTKSGRDEFFGTVEGITSEVLDPYGLNNVSATVGGPLFSDNLNFFLAADYRHADDASPRAVGTPQLSETDLDFLRQHPQSLRIVNDETGEEQYIAFPTAFTDTDEFREDGISAEEALALADVPEGFSIESYSPVLAPRTYQNDMFEREAKNDPVDDLTFSGNLQFSPVESVRLRVGGSLDRFSGKEFSYLRSLYAPERMRLEDRDTWRVFGSWTQYLSDNIFYQITGSFEDYQGADYHPSFSDDVRDALYYGDVDHPANVVASRYVSFDAADSTYTRLYAADGNFPSAQQIQNSFAAPGVDPFSGFTQFHDTRFGIQANATAQLGIHQLNFGGEFEQRTERYFNLASADGLARYFDDGNAESAGGNEDLIVDSYEELSYDILEEAGVFYYGYNYLGTEEVDDQSLEGFNATGDAQNTNMAPYQPIYYAGYVSDKVEYQDLILQIGMRVDVFDANTLVLRDPYALLPIVRAGELSNIPGNVGSDYAVYFDGSGNRVGYRDLEGNFYDTDGSRGDVREIKEAGAPQSKLDDSGNPITTLTPEVFTDYEPQVSLQPRIGVSFPVTNRALFFASYDVQSQRPQTHRFDTIQQYAEALGRSLSLHNPALEPERSVNYELGFRQRLGERAAFTLSGFYRQIDNLISQRIVPNVYPNNYQTYRNVDFGTIKGVEAEFELRRTQNIALNANYTLSFAQGTGSDANTTGQINWQQESNPFYPRFISPMDFDQRHNLVMTMDYRLGEGEGPQFMGGHPLSNFGVNLIANIASGLPYTKEVEPRPINDNAHNKPAGGINQQTMPVTTMLNLRVDRKFDVGGADLTAFLWVENLLNSDNVQNVYAFTGQANEDGYIPSDLGRDAIAGIASTQGDQVANSYVDHYYMRINSPFNYGIPRQTRLGLRLTF